MPTRTAADDESIAVVVNGIIENHEQLRQELQADGAIFTSQTDSEVIPHLLARHYDGDPIGRCGRSPTS